MASSGSDKRQRDRVIRVRVSAEEQAKARLRADRSGLSMSAYFRAAALDTKPLRAERQPAVNRQEVAKLIGELGKLRQSLKDAALVADRDRCAALIEGLERDFWELRALCFEALGREP
jgi:hypothetical protein